MAESNFCGLHREVKDGSKPFDELPEHPAYKKRVGTICQLLTRDQTEAEILYWEVCYKVWLKMDSFIDNCTPGYCSLLAMARRMAKNRFLDNLHKNKAKFDNERPEDLSIADPRMNIECLLIESAREAEIKRTIEGLPREQRLAATLLVLKERSSRRAAKVMNRLGIECSHVTVLAWAREGLKPLFPERESSAIKPVRKARARRRGRSGKRVTVAVRRKAAA